MKLSRLSLITAVVLAGSALNAPRANAVPVSCAPGGGGPAGTVVFGLGGAFSGCWGGFYFAALYENAGAVSNYYAINPGSVCIRDGVTNAPTGGTSTTFLYNDNCGSNGAGTGDGHYCPPPISPLFAWGQTGEMIFAENNLDAGQWYYSGPDATRNSPPTPEGRQNFLWYISGGVYDGWYLLGWEDKNSGCLTASSSTSGVADGTKASNTYNGTTILNGAPLDNNPTPGSVSLNDLQGTCTSFSAGTPGSINPSDDDFNDFYMLIRPYTPDEFRELTPEPMTMSLLATGLLGIGGASLRRRKNRK